MRPYQVMLVEDSPDDVELTLWALAEVGLREVQVAFNGGQALKLLGEGRRPDLVLLDLKLPLVDGRAVLARIRANPRLNAIPVVVLSASEDLLDQAACKQLGATAFLAKPLDANELVALLQL